MTSKLKKLKMWIGNLDGRRQGLVIAATKARAVEVAGVGRTDFNAHWHQLREIDPALDPEVLYTRPYADGIRGAKTWVHGRCAL
jgi:hypothetical protein